MYVIYGCSIKSLGADLTLCTFSRRVVRVSFKSVYPPGLWPSNGARYGFRLVEQAFKPIRMYLVTSITLTPLLYQGKYLAVGYYSLQGSKLGKTDD